MLPNQVCVHTNEMAAVAIFKQSRYFGLECVHTEVLEPLRHLLDTPYWKIFLRCRPRTEERLSARRPLLGNPHLASDKVEPVCRCLEACTEGPDSTYLQRKKGKCPAKVSSC